ncbi:MAG: DUF563 domain-containing protein [Chloroflexota bacterium]
MDLRRLAAFGGKAATKAAWMACSALSPAPGLETLHHARVVEQIRQRYVDVPGGSHQFVQRTTRRTYIEPDWGYLIGSGGHLIEESLSPNFAYPLPTWRIAQPSPRSFVQARRGTFRTVHVPRAISLRHPWEWNYYHFYLDVLGKLQLFESIGVDQSVPLVLGRYAMELPYVEQAISLGALKDRTWIVQDRFYVVADEVFYCRTKQPHKVKADYVLDAMGVPRQHAGGEDRVFLTRGAHVPRHIVNMEQVQDVLRAHDFRVIDVAGWPLREQIELFGRTRYLIGIHGAGLTNMIFRRDAPMSVLELHADSYRSRDFEDICEQFGYGWDHLDGRSDNPNANQFANFALDPDRLEEKIRQMLEDRMPPLPPRGDVMRM